MEGITEQHSKYVYALLQKLDFHFLLCLVGVCMCVVELFGVDLCLWMQKL